MKFKQKRILSLLLITLLLSLSLVGCTSEEAPAEETSMDLTEETEEVSSESEGSEESGLSLEEAINNYFANKPDHSYLIAEGDFIEKVKADEDIFILDIRQADAYAEGHIKGAVNAPWGTAISENLKYIPKDKEVFVYCYSGQTAGQAVLTLNVAGFNARSVKYGWNFGLSKADGVAEVTETVVNNFPEETTAISSEVQEALDSYYAGLSDVKETKFKNYKISEDNLKAMIDADEDFTLVSFRREADYNEGHIEGAQLLSYGKNMQEKFDMLPKDKTIVGYCYSGQTAGQAVAALRLLGYDIVSLNGGMGTAKNAPLGWVNKGYPVVGVNVIEDQVNDYFAQMPDHIYKIGQADFVEMVKIDQDMTIIDIRQPDAYAEGHIKGAVNIPWGPAISENLSSIPNDKPVFIYCYSGQTAGQAVHTLNVAGFDARSVNLGWNFGISKVEGVDEVTDTTEYTLDGNTEINGEVQSALTAYYEGLADVKETKFKNYKISEDNLKAMIDTEEDFYLLSIRQEKAYNAGHIAGADILPFGNDMYMGFNMIPKDKKVVVYCYSGQTAGQTVAALKLLGYDAVSLNGGMGVGSNAPIGWTNKGYETVAGTALEYRVNDYFATIPSNNNKISQVDFVELVKAGEWMTILDIRQPDAYNEGHVKGAINIPWGADIGENLANIPNDLPVFVYCYSGQTAGQAVTTLNVAGFNARSVNLGWNFGISKVEGIDEVTVTDGKTLNGKVTYILPSVDEALKAYYNGLADVKETTYKNYKISEDNLKAMMEADEDFYLLSIRQEEAYNEGHIEGANLIPWGAGMNDSFKDLPMDEKIVVYCYSGQTAGQTVAGLKLLNYDAVSLNGGMGVGANAPIGWTNKGYPVVQ